MTLPNVSETYVHRIGRTGRASASGIALSFCMGDERPYLKDIEKPHQTTSAPYGRTSFYGRRRCGGQIPHYKTSREIQ